MSEFHLPDGPRGPGYATAIWVSGKGIFLLRKSGHLGPYYALPGGFVTSDEPPEAVCAREALREMRNAAIELAGQLKEDFDEERLAISVRQEFASHPWKGGQTYRYFLIASNGMSRLYDHSFAPNDERYQIKMGVWIPYEWVSLDSLPTKNLVPDEALAICQRAIIESRS